MTAILFVALTVGFAEPDKGVTEAEKKAFLELLRTLPTRRWSFTEEAIEKAAPHTRVLLALTEKDLDKLDLYAFLALSGGLASRKDSREYAVTNFAKIAHPELKLFWAASLFDQKAASPEILPFLRKALDSKRESKILSSMLGPAYEDFRARVIEADNLRRQTKVALVKEHSTSAFPQYSEAYTKPQYAFAPGQLLYAIRPVEQRGELNAYHLDTGKTSRLTIPQPEGFTPISESIGSFNHPVLSVNVRGDMLCRWTIRGNGDHGLALIDKASGTTLVKRLGLYLPNSWAIADPEGQWYLVVADAGDLTIYHVDRGLNVTRLGNYKRRGHNDINIFDATFLSKDTLHLFWGDVLPGGNHLRLRCVDFAVKDRQWLHGRELFRLDQFVSSASEPTVIRGKDDSLHYLWQVDEGATKGEATGVYYQAEADGKTVKVSSSGRGYRAIAAGDRLIVGYTLEQSPDKVFFRVIQHGALGPVGEITIAKGRKHNLWSESMALFAEASRIWFLNTTNRGTLFELKMVEQVSP